MNFFPEKKENPKKTSIFLCEYFVTILKYKRDLLKEMFYDILLKLILILGYITILRKTVIS